MIGGLGKIDIDDWKRNTRLKHCSLETNVVRWFWRMVDEYDEEHRARLLQFVTGSSRVPLQGFKALQGNNIIFWQIIKLQLGHHCKWLWSVVCVVFVMYELTLYGLNKDFRWWNVFVGSTGSQGPRLFTIHQVDTNTDNLPKAHTWWVWKCCG